MTFATILFATAFLISAVAEYYAIAGLVAIFASNPVGAIVLGCALAAGKLVAASWLYRNWKEAPKFLKYYFTSAVLILSLITSMGIFGYLSKAHLEQAVIIGGNADQVKLIDEKIKTSKENIEQSRKALKQLDEAVDQTMARSTSEEGASKATALRRSQQTERKRLLAAIEAEQKRLSVLNEERLPLSAELNKIEAEVGPIKYVAELVYGESTNEMIDKAVRLMIVLIIFVFDPLAILLLIAANMEMRKNAPPKSIEKVAPIDEKKEENVMQQVPSALTPRKPKKPLKPKKPIPSIPKKKPVTKPKPKKKPTVPKKPRKAPATPKRKKPSIGSGEDVVLDNGIQNPDEYVQISKSKIYRFDG
jgi:hypothetical protein